MKKIRRPEFRDVLAFVVFVFISIVAVYSLASYDGGRDSQATDVQSEAEEGVKGMSLEEMAKKQGMTVDELAALLNTIKTDTDARQREYEEHGHDHEHEHEDGCCRGECEGEW